MGSTFRPHQTALLAAAGVSLLGLFVGPVDVALLPLRYLNTHLHELCHALATLLTGGHVDQIRVFGDGSGVTPVSGGFLAFIASAGYLGAALVGAAIIFAMRTERGARMSLLATGAALGLSMVGFVRGDTTGVISGLFWTAILLLAGLKLRGPWLSFSAALIGLQQGVNAIRSLFELFQISAMTERHSDAKLMAQYYVLPAVFWAGLWGLCGLALIVFTLRRVWSLPQTSAPTRPVG